MKKMIYLVLVLISIGTMVSCEKKSEGKTQITIYADLQLEGDEVMIVNKGDQYVEPGYKATMNGADVTNQVKVSDDIDTKTSGIYTITYSIKNADGFEASKERTVYVYNTADPIEGIWACTPESDCEGTVYGDSYSMFICPNEDGTYAVDDLLSGWYAQRKGYGSDYAMLATIAIETGSIELLESIIPAWGDSAEELTDGVIDTDKGTMSYKLVYYGMTFNITLNKVIFE